VKNPQPKYGQEISDVELDDFLDAADTSLEQSLGRKVDIAEGLRTLLARKAAESVPAYESNATTIGGKEPLILRLLKLTHSERPRPEQVKDSFTDDHVDDARESWKIPASIGGIIVVGLLTLGFWALTPATGRMPNHIQTPDHGNSRTFMGDIVAPSGPSPLIPQELVIGGIGVAVLLTLGFWALTLTTGRIPNHIQTPDRKASRTFMGDIVAPSGPSPLIPQELVIGGTTYAKSYVIATDCGTKWMDLDLTGLTLKPGTRFTAVLGIPGEVRNGHQIRYKVEVDGVVRVEGILEASTAPATIDIAVNGVRRLILVASNNTKSIDESACGGGVLGVCDPAFSSPLPQD